MITVTVPGPNTAFGPPTVKHRRGEFLLGEQGCLIVGRGDGETIACYAPGFWISAVASTPNTPPGAHRPPLADHRRSRTP